MATQFDATMVPLATKMLAKFGTTATFYVPTSSTYDPTTGAETEAGVTATSWLSTPPMPVGHRLLQREVVKQGDMVVYIAAESITFTPALGMRVGLAARSWRIVELLTYYSGDSIAIYELVLRA